MLDDAELVNRFGYHRATADSAPQHAAVRDKCLEFAQWLNSNVPAGRDLSLALTSLQETMHWANSAIAMVNDVDTETAHLPNAGSPNA